MSLAEDPKLPEPEDYLAELKTYPQWVVWRYFKRVDEEGKVHWEKIPVDPKTLRWLSWNKPSNQMSYEEASRISRGNPRIDGIGFVPTKDDPFTFPDFDDVIDPDTGEVLKPWALDLIDKLGTYTEISPSGTGFRAIIKGKMSTTGGYHSLDGDENAFEIYDSKHWLTITENPYREAPIQKNQAFIDRLVPFKRPSKKPIKDIADLPEINLDEELSEIHQTVKRVFVKHDLSPYFIQEGTRRNTLLSECGKIYKTGEYTDEEFWIFLNEVNSTLLVNKDGELEGLPEDELAGVYEAIIRMGVKKSEPEVLSIIKTIENFLISIKTQIRGTHDSHWKIMKALMNHGKKYGQIQNDYLRVDISYGEISKLSRIRTDKTISNTIKKLRKMGVTSAKDYGDQSNHYLIDVEEITKLHNWFYAQVKESKRELYKDPNKDSLDVDKKLTSNTTLPLHNSEVRELIEAIDHTTWYRGIGPTKINYVLAIVLNGGEARSKEIAEITGRKETSLSRPMKELVEAGIIYKAGRGVYKVDLANLPDQIHNFREKREEFLRDEAQKIKVEEKREQKRASGIDYTHKKRVPKKPVTLPKVAVSEDPERRGT